MTAEDLFLLRDHIRLARQAMPLEHSEARLALYDAWTAFEPEHVLNVSSEALESRCREADYSLLRAAKQLPAGDLLETVKQLRAALASIRVAVSCSVSVSEKLAEARRITERTTEKLNKLK